VSTPDLRFLDGGVGVGFVAPTGGGNKAPKPNPLKGNVIVPSPDTSGLTSPGFLVIFGLGDFVLSLLSPKRGRGSPGNSNGRKEIGAIFGFGATTFFASIPKHLQKLIYYFLSHN
jgi:hypothetical protein